MLNKSPPTKGRYKTQPIPMKSKVEVKANENGKFVSPKTMTLRIGGLSSTAKKKNNVNFVKSIRYSVENEKFTRPKKYFVK